MMRAAVGGSTWLAGMGLHLHAGATCCPHFYHLDLHAQSQAALRLPSFYIRPVPVPEHGLPHCLQSVTSPAVETVTALAPTKMQPLTQVSLQPEHACCRVTPKTAGLHSAFHVRVGSGSNLHQASLMSRGLVCQAFMVAGTTYTLAYVS